MGRSNEFNIGLKGAKCQESIFLRLHRRTAMASGATERREERPRVMTHSMRERLSEKNGSRKTIFGVLSNKKYEV